MYSVKHFTAGDFRHTKLKVLNWLQQFGTFCFLDSHHYKVNPHAQECLAGAGVRREVTAPAGDALSALDIFLKEKENNTWLFGHLSYDIKNELAPLHTAYADKSGFPDLYFFEPEIVLRLNDEELQIHATDPDAVYAGIVAQKIETVSLHESLQLSQKLTREEYIQTVQQLQEHIRRGDCYEINFCQEFFAEKKNLDPLQLYKRLGEISPSPFSAFYRCHTDAWLMSASPERFLLRQGDRLIAQPIKGTAPRILHDKIADEQSREALRSSEKDRAENVMIVDLMRNDLSRVCDQGSVGVDELFGIYSYPQVHQMISTISGKIDPDKTFTDIIRACFPMGSMTGAPKQRVMELIDQYETMRRGIFSGAVGYMAPGGDFDFNVVIRSLLYNARTGYLSAPAGSAITFYSDAANEWEECLLKIKGLNAVLSA
jgi:para-aminobenzoate synthetase component 1